jgi:hypothetical protein
MPGFGPPANHRARQQWWRRPIQRQQDRGISIAEFCRRLGARALPEDAASTSRHQSAVTDLRMNLGRNEDHRHKFLNLNGLQSPMNLMNLASPPPALACAHAGGARSKRFIRFIN